jgi:deoxyribonuclease-4
MGKLLFGSAGIPWSASKRNTVGGIERIKELNLDLMELSFTRGVYLSKDDADLVRKTAERNEITLSVHAPYWINFNSVKPEVSKKSRKWLGDSAIAGFRAGAKKIVFHPGVYQKKTPAEALEIISNALRDLSQELQENGVKVLLCPELTGKLAQFGTLDELLIMANDIEGVSFTLDFAHLHARAKGNFKTQADFARVLEKIEQANPAFLKDLHMHVSGINYGEKGELNHLNLKESDFPFQAWLNALKEFNVSGTSVSESPNLEDDAQLLKKTFNSP